MEQVLLLNQDYTFLGTVNWKRALSLVMKGKAEVVKYTDRTVCNAENTVSLRVPKILKLLYFIQKVYKSHMTYNRRVVFMRDAYECGYCGAKDRLTIDHVLPKSRGGKTSFENTVTSCWTCNNKKGDKTPVEAKMKMSKKLYSPTIMEYITKYAKFKGQDIEHIITSIFKA